MKRRIWITITGVVVCLAAVCACIVGYMASKSMDFSVGRVLQAENGSYLVILDGSPVRMTDRTEKKALFNKLETGDKILLLHDGIQETYPGRTGVYAVIKLGSGSIDDISPQVLEQLAELGWVSSSTDKQHK